MKGLTRTNRIFLTGAAFCAMWAGRAAANTAETVKGVLALFDRYPVVGIGEERHGKQENGAFYLALIHDPEFPVKVNNVVLECANQLYQPLLDRYAAGEDIPFREISKVWRNTTQIAVWDAPIYQRVIDAVREVNKTLPPARRIRMLAGDPPIDWSRIRTLEDYNLYKDRETPYARVIESDVLNRKQTALVIIGRMHLTSSGGRVGQPNARTMLESRSPGKVYLLSIFDGSEDPAIAVFLSGIQGPALIPVDRPEAAAAFSHFVSRLSPSAKNINSFCDGVLFISPPGRLAYPSAQDLDPDYIAEMSRRIRIVYGDDWRPVFDNRMGERALLMRAAIETAVRKIIERTVAPKATDPRVTLPDDPRSVHLVFVPEAGRIGRLFVFMPGSGGVPGCCRLIEQAAARFGYHSIGLAIATKVAAAQCKQDLDCYGAYRRDLFDGFRAGSEIFGNAANSTENLLAKLLLKLDHDHPEEEWRQFLNGPPTDAALPRWDRIVVAGLSLGAGEAAYIGKARTVSRVIQFAGTVDSDDANPPHPAKWVSEMKSATPADHFYGFVHTADPFWKLNKTNRNWQALGMQCGLVSVDELPPPYNHSHCLTTSLASGGRPHTAVVSDRDTPRDENGVPTFLAVWRYLLATPE